MLITRTTYDSLLARIADLEKQLAVAATNSDWYRLRINVLERERAEMLTKLTGINVSAPQIEKRDPDAAQGPIGAPLSTGGLLGAAMFDDVGDREAQRLGIYHDDSGIVAYRK